MSRNRLRGWNWVVTSLLVFSSCSAAAHHSLVAFYDRSMQTDVEGTITSVFWRNPHVAVTVLVDNDQGEQEEWQLQGGTVNDLVRRGFTRESLQIGTRIRATGAPSRRGENTIYLNSLLSATGEELLVFGLVTPPAAADGDDSATGIFRVWVNGGTLYRLRSPLALTAAAQAARDAWDPFTDDPGLLCEAPGMPNAILNPYPIEFVDQGDSILIRIEEWDAIRVVHMNTEADSKDQAPSPLGYSVGRWEGGTLVIETTRVEWPYLDDLGTPQSEAVEIHERFTVNEDETRIDYELTVTDPQNLLATVVWDAFWVYDPGAEIHPFECTLQQDGTGSESQ